MRDVKVKRQEHKVSGKEGWQAHRRGDEIVTGQPPRVYHRRERLGDPWVMSMK